MNPGTISVVMRRLLRSTLAGLLIWIPFGLGVSAHSSAQATGQEATQAAELAPPVSVSQVVVPQQVRFEGKIADRTGATVEAEFRIYAAQEGGEPLWTETQQVAVAKDGSYSVLLGGVSPAGLPQTVFAGGAARWLGVSVDRGQELERVLLSSVPYAMKSADAESLAGHAAADFVTQEQLASLAGHTVPAPDVQPDTSGTVTGSGTANTVPLWTGSLTQGNSIITQVGSDIGINNATPAATLDVAGTATIRGMLTVPPEATATTAGGYRSELLQLGASTWSTTTGGPVNQNFNLVTLSSANNTANPSGVLTFQFQQGTAPVTNILSMASNGVLTFAPTQTFPGTIKSVAGTSPVTATTSAGAVTVGLNTSALETTLNGVYAQLNAANTFTKPITFASNQTFPITGTGGGTITGITTSSPLTGSGSSGSVALGLNQSTLVTNITPSLETTFNGIYPQLGTANTFTAGQTIKEASSISGSNDSAMLTVSNGESVGILAYGGADSIGIQTFGTQTSGSIGLLGSLANSNGLSGSFFLLNNDDGLDAGVWADGPDGQQAALIATADDPYAGVFYNDSATYPTILALNNNSSGTTGLVSRRIDSVIRAGGPGGMCGINQTGNLACTGQVKTLVSAKNSARQLETYTVQSAENWIEDYGSGVLSNGSATVQVEPEFAETVNTEVGFHVFLTPGGDCKGLYVTNKTPGSFEVHELGGGTSSIPFDYKIVAKRNGMEGQRLTDVTEQLRTEAEAVRFKPLGHPLPRTRDARPRPASTPTAVTSAKAR